MSASAINMVDSSPTPPSHATQETTRFMQSLFLYLSDKIWMMEFFFFHVIPKVSCISRNHNFLTFTLKIYIFYKLNEIIRVDNQDKDH